jgi:hypothetical protein
LRAYNEETLRVERTRRITPAAEWLLDNFYLIRRPGANGATASAERIQP